MYDADGILRPKVTTKMVGLTDRYLRMMEEVGEFPQRFKLFEGGKAVGHLKSEVLAWMEERAASRDTVKLKTAEEYDAETLDSDDAAEGDEEDEEEDTET